MKTNIGARMIALFEARVAFLLGTMLLVCAIATASASPAQDNPAETKTTVAVEPLCWAAGEQELNVRPSRHRTPSLPAELTKEPSRLSILLKVCIDATGRVPRTFVLRSSDNAAVDTFFQNATLKWTFKPAQKSGKPVPSFMKMSVNWNIE
jgi:TonB family protein